MLATHVVPRLRAQGYRGRTQKLTIHSGPIVGEISLQRSLHNTRSEKAFTFNLRVLNGDEVVWVSRIGPVLPEQKDVWWTLDGETAVERIGPTVGVALEHFACPAISVVMEDPNRRHVPEDARSFVVPDRHSTLSIKSWEWRRWTGQMQEASLNWKLDECLTKLDDVDWFLRFLARERLRQTYQNDPRSIQAYVDALAREDFPETRVGIALVLGFWPGGTSVERALEEASRLDEDARVRWAARYAILMRRDPRV